MPPAGRPRTSANRDLPPGLLRRERRGKIRYYFQLPDKKQLPLGEDLAKALARWHELHSQSRAHVPNAFSTVADEFEKHGIKGLAVKTQAEYKTGLKRLRKVFGAAPIETIRPKHVGALLHELRDTPFQANRLKALLSRLWNWARSRGITDAPNPCIGVEGYSEEARRVIVTPEMFWAIHEQASERLRDWMELDRLIGDRVSDVLLLRRKDVEQEGNARWLRTKSSKTGVRGRIEVTGDLSTLIDRLVKRERTATGPWLIQSDSGQRVTYAMLRNDFDHARAEVRKTAPDLADWQLRDMRKTALNDAPDLETARRRAKHTDPRTTARHYETLIDSVPANLPKKITDRGQ